MENYVIRLENVNFFNDNYQILENININIKLNTFNTIIGRSGSGKTTLLKIMAGLLEPQSGNVYIYDKNIKILSNKEILKYKKKIGYAFQDSALLSNLTIKENLELPLKFHYPKIEQKKIDDKINFYLEKVMLTDSLNLRPAQLSNGEQKMVSLIRALITDPELLFIDEPLSSIDVLIAQKILKIIYEYTKQEWTTVIAVSHSKDLILNLSDNIIFLDDKTIKLYDSLENILNKDCAEIPQFIYDLLFLKSIFHFKE